MGVTSNIVVVNRRLRARRAKIAHINQFFTQRKEAIHVAGVESLYRTVYSIPEGRYKRTQNLLNSFETNIIKDGNSVGIELVIEPNESIRANEPGDYAYYPSYVLRGMFWNPGAPRPIVANWSRDVGNPVEKEIHQVFADAVRV